MFNNIFEQHSGKGRTWTSGIPYPGKGAKRWYGALARIRGWKTATRGSFAFYDDIIKLYEEHTEQMIKTCQKLKIRG